MQTMAVLIGDRTVTRLTVFVVTVMAMALFQTASAEDACAPVSKLNFSTPPPFTTESYTFTSDATSLTACFYRPKELKTFPVLVEVAGSDDTPTASGIYEVIHAKALTARGVGLFAFNKRGIGGSGGMPSETNFAERAKDVASAVAFVRSLPTTNGLALWGVSQGGWVVPQALKRGDGVAFVVLTSPSGVNPFEQVAFYVHNLALELGLSQDDADKAETVHRAVASYYATGRGYSAAQRLVDRFASEAWFEKFRTNDEWNERIGRGGKLLTRAELKRAWVEQADDFRFYRAPSTFADYEPIYKKLDRKALIIDGTADKNVPYEQSEAVIKRALSQGGNSDVEFKLFDGAGHGIQDGPRVRAAYLDFLGDWIARAFKGGSNQPHAAARFGAEDCSCWTMKTSSSAVKRAAACPAAAPGRAIRRLFST